jgi:hypothetical protein
VFSLLVSVFFFSLQHSGRQIGTDNAVNLLFLLHLVLGQSNFFLDINLYSNIKICPKILADAELLFIPVLTGTN